MKTRPLKLPGGGTFDLPVLHGADVDLDAPDAAPTLPRDLAPRAAPGLGYAVLAGALLGGLFVWVLWPRN